MINRLWILLCLLLTCYAAIAQNNSVAIDSRLIAEYLSDLNIKADRLSQKLDRFTAKAMKKVRKQDNDWRRKLEKRDSIKAAIVADNINGQLEQRLQNATAIRQYSPSLDTITTSLKFLAQSPQLASVMKRSLEKLQGVESRLEKAEGINEFLNVRKQYLRNQLQDLELTTELRRLNKEAYYYSAQLNEYKLLLGDHKTAGQKLIGLLSKTKIFQDFMQKNSALASLFRLPGDPNDPVNLSSFAGLQTSAQVNSLLLQQIGGNGLTQFRLNLQDARSQLQQIKNEVSRLGGNGSVGDHKNNREPDRFVPNHQKTKSFLKRLEYGANVQTQKASNFFPVTSDIGLSAGYKLSDKSIIGIGAIYKIGWGDAWKNINITNQGIGLRSFLYWKLKGSLWLSGGYEQHYKTAFKNIEALRDHKAWQHSGLAGLSKTVSLKTKFLKKARLQLLWDFLSYQQAPVTQPVIFRIEYSLSK